MTGDLVGWHEYRQATRDVFGISDDVNLTLTPVGVVARLGALHGLIGLGLQHVRASALLADAGLLGSSEVCARAAFEHAVTVQWAHLMPNGLALMQQRLDNSYESYAANVVEALNEGSLRRKGGTGIRIRAMLGDFQGGDTLYDIAYRSLSQAGHPSVITQSAGRDDAGRPVALPSDRPTEHVWVTDAVSAALLLGVFADLCPDPSLVAFNQSTWPPLGITPLLPLATSSPTIP